MNSDRRGARFEMAMPIAWGSVGAPHTQSRVIGFRGDSMDRSDRRRLNRHLFAYETELLELKCSRVILMSDLTQPRAERIQDVEAAIALLRAQLASLKKTKGSSK